MKSFVHLHVHSEYSLLDGAGRIKDLVRAAGEMGMPALALTDHGVMYGAVEFYKAAREQGLKPIIGCEVYVAPRSRHDREPRRDDYQYHLVLLAADATGYRNLTALVSAAFLEGFYYKPRVDRELLSRHSQGLIALSACLAGEVPAHLLKNQEDAAYDAATWLREVFGPENFYLELQDHGLPEQRQLNRQLVDLATRLKIPLVATNDVHYVRQDQARAHDVLLCIQTGKTLDDPNRLRFPTAQFYLKSPAEMDNLFREVPSALANTLAIAERCQFDFTFGRLHLPAYQVPAGEDAASYLRRLSYEGLERRYPRDDGTARQRLEYELGVIEQMGYPGYFLIVWDMVNFARRRGIPVGPGRGSAAGSLVAYCLGITSIDPLRYNLLFERFLNPERVSMPDIDMDFCFERRDEVIQYVLEKYGRDHVAQIITFGTMAARAAVRDVGRVLGLPLNEVDRIAKMVPMELGITLERALATSPDLKESYEGKREVRELLDTARAIEGMPRHASTHAAGIVITREPLIHYLPLQKTGDAVTTQYPMQAVEELGLLKMDLLGLRTLTVIGHAREAIRRNYGWELDLENLPLDDRPTYQLLTSGETSGIFQLESSGMRAILKELKPERFEDIIALVALYRPGPLGSGMVEDFIKRKHGVTPISYLHPALEPILKDTYGVILYQEQVMRIASELAGFTLGQADLLRRAMGKKKPEVLAAQRDRFLAGAEAKAIPRDVAQKIFELMEYFAGYGFNASHSAAYALVAYQTAYLKAHYPVELMGALLSSVAEHLDKMGPYLAECQRLGIAVLPPDVNESGVDFTVRGRQIRFGLAAVKNAGRAAALAIIAAREAGGPFTSLLDFCRRVDSRQANKRVVESLIRCGAFNSINPNRRQLLAGLDECLEAAARRQEDRRSGQVSLMDLVPGEVSDPPLPQVTDFSRADILAMEKELLGFYLSGHPLEPYAQVLKKLASHSLADLAEIADGSQVTVGGLVSGLRRLVTRKGDPMAVLTLEDFSGQVEAVIFPRVYSQVRSWLAPDRAVLVQGQVDKQEEGAQVLANLVRPLVPESGGGDRTKPTGRLIPPDGPTGTYHAGPGTGPAGQASAGYETARLYLKLSGQGQLTALRDTLTAYPGPCPVYLYLADSRRTIALHRRYWIKPVPELLASLAGLLGGYDKIKLLQENRI
ncbi:MAG: polymerase subunit alpha [Moorella sp. (in: firmicutes)]|nr:polymerase subunit alpha [Moorella sp. (in: firmicutes)]